MDGRVGRDGWVTGGQEVFSLCSCIRGSTVVCTSHGFYITSQEMGDEKVHVYVLIGSCLQLHMKHCLRDGDHCCRPTGRSEVLVLERNRTNGCA